MAKKYVGVKTKVDKLFKIQRNEDRDAKKESRSETTKESCNGKY